MQPIKALVTGGLGFLGSNLVLELLHRGASVTVVDPCTPGCGGNADNLGSALQHVQWLPHDIADVSRIKDAIARATVVYNLAGEIRHHHSMVQPERDLDLNARSQLLFLQACAECNPGVRIVYAGTRQVYGIPKYLPVDEDHPVEPVDFNGVHKYAASSYHLMLSRLGLMDACVLRLSNVYGPHMALEVPGQGFLATFVKNLRDGSQLTVFGDGQQLRDPIYVDDAVEAFVLAGTAASLSSRSYNLGGPDALTLFGIASEAARAAGKDSPTLQPFPGHLQRIDIGHYVANSNRIRSELGWIPRVSFEDGIRKTLDFYGVAPRHGSEGRAVACRQTA